MTCDKFSFCEHPGAYFADIDANHDFSHDFIFADNQAIDKFFVVYNWMITYYLTHFLLSTLHSLFPISVCNVRSLHASPMESTDLCVRIGRSI